MSWEALKTLYHSRSSCAYTLPFESALAGFSINSEHVPTNRSTSGSFCFMSSSCAKIPVRY